MKDASKGVQPDVFECPTDVRCRLKRVVIFFNIFKIGSLSSEFFRVIEFRNFITAAYRTLHGGFSEVLSSQQ